MGTKQKMHKTKVISTHRRHRERETLETMCVCVNYKVCLFILLHSLARVCFLDSLFVSDSRWRCLFFVSTCVCVDVWMADTHALFCVIPIPWDWRVSSSCVGQPAAWWHHPAETTCDIISSVLNTKRANAKHQLWMEGWRCVHVYVFNNCIFTFIFRFYQLTRGQRRSLLFFLVSCYTRVHACVCVAAS